MSGDKKNTKNIDVEFLEEEEKNISKEDKVEDADEEKENEAAAEDKTEKEKKSNDKKQQNYDELKEKYDNLNDQFMRLRAEFSNYKRRVEKDQIEYSNYIKSETVKHLLPILDDMRHMLEKAEKETDNKSLFEGAKLIYDKFEQSFKDLGVERIEAIGQEFDPQIHEAMMMQKINDAEKHNKILSVFQEGYILKNRLIRPSKVIVGNYDEENAEESDNEEN